MTTFDYNHFFVNRTWIWTAITRATELGNVYYYTGEQKANINEEKLIEKYLSNKINKYKQQDKNRDIIEDKYITVGWLKKGFSKSCVACGCALTYELNGNVITSNLTANIILNDEPHHKINCEYMCVSCNTSLSNK